MLSDQRRPVNAEQIRRRAPGLEVVEDSPHVLADLVVVALADRDRGEGQVVGRQGEGLDADDLKRALTSKFL